MDKGEELYKELLGLLDTVISGYTFAIIAEKYDWVSLGLNYTDEYLSVDDPNSERRIELPVLVEKKYSSYRILDVKKINWNEKGEENIGIQVQEDI